MNTIRPYLYTFILVVFALFGKAQPAEVARLVNRLKAPLADTARVHIYSDLAKIYGNNDIDSVKFYALKSYALYKKEKSAYSAMYASSAMGFYYRSYNMPDSAVYFFSESRKNAEKIGHWNRTIAGYINISNVYTDVARYDKSLETLYKAMGLAEKRRDSSSIAKIHKIMGSTYHEMGMWDDVILHANAGVKYFEPHKDSADAARCYSLLGIAYMQQKKYALADAQNDKALLLNPIETGLPSLYYAVLTNRGLLYDEIGRDDEALKLYQTIYDSLLVIGSSRQISVITNNMAHIYLQKNDKKNAEKFFLLSLGEAKRQLSPVDIRDAALSLATLTSERGDYAKAFEFQQLAYAYNDTITNADKAKAIAEVSTLYEVDKKEEENKRLLQIAQIKDLQITQQYIAIGAMAFVLLFIVFGGIYFYRQRKFIAEQREKILEQKLLQMQLNPHFIFNSLIAIQDYIYNNNTAQAGSYLSKFAKLMRSTLENSRSEVIPLFKEIEGLENYLALQKLRLGTKLHYEVIVSDTVDLFTTEIPPMLIQPFVENAVEHGVQMKEGKGLVTVSFELKGTMLNISIKDDGPGMSEKAKINNGHNSLSIQIINERLELLAKRKNNEPAIIIHSKEKLGTLVELSFPIA